MLSVIVFILPIRLIYKKNYSRWYIGALIYIFICVFLVKMLIGYFGVWEEGDSIRNLKDSEIFIDSLVHALRSFSLDEDYTAYTAAGKKFFLSHGLAGAAAVFGVVNSILNVLAPLLGGTVLLEILSNIFPKFQLFLKSFRSKFVFSELNDASITLAEALHENKNGITDKILKNARNLKAEVCHEVKKAEAAGMKCTVTNPAGRSRQILEWAGSHLPFASGSPLIVFTDIYIDRESETNSELIERTKTIRAVCVDSDLNHLKLGSSRHVYYFLMDTNSQENVREVAFLLGERGRKLWPFRQRIIESTDPSTGKTDSTAVCVQDTEIYTFLDSDKKCDLTLKYYGKTGDGKMKDAVMLRPIRDYMNACFNLLYDVPLFLPLLSEQDTDGIRDLTVTIIGGGSIAEEAFKTVYWCGQMQRVSLHVNIISDNAYVFRKRIENNYPELLESCRSGSPLLRVSPDKDKEEFNAPYIQDPQFAYIRNASILSDYPENVLDKTDYYIIAVGDDEKALDITSRIRLHLERKTTETDCPRKRVIAPAVFLPEVAEGLRNVEPASYEPYVIPFASLTQRFNCKNVFMERFVTNSSSSDDSEHFYGPADLKSETQDSYQYWAKIARTVHAPYKAFGMGLIDSVDVSGTEAVYSLRDVSGLKDLQQKKDEISWIEHRRWNAFMRTQGFRSATREQMERFWKDCGEHKDLRRKLHICLVESRAWSTHIAEQENEYDCLDAASALVRKKRPEKSKHDFKKYDAFGYDNALSKFLDFSSQK